MGIYSDHGIEYHVVRGGRRVCIASTRQTDARLLASDYYARRKDSWFSRHVTWCVKIDETDLDVALTAGERTLLDATLQTSNEKKEENTTHGWYDVQTLTDTYSSSYYSYGGNSTPRYVVTLKNGSKLKVCDEAADGKTISAHDADVLDSMLRVHGDNVASHGWIS
jgi:hypothetical protein